MWDGRTVAVRDIGATTKLGLVADMLGRDPAEISASGMTELGGDRGAAGEEVLSLQDVGTGRSLRDVSLVVRRGEIVALGGLLGSGRTETARAIFGLDAVRQGQIQHDRVIYGHVQRIAGLGQGGGVIDGMGAAAQEPHHRIGKIRPVLDQQNPHEPLVSFIARPD